MILIKKILIKRKHKIFLIKKSALRSGGRGGLESEGFGACVLYQSSLSGPGMAGWPNFLDTGYGLTIYTMIP